MKNINKTDELGNLNSFNNIKMENAIKRITIVACSNPVEVESLYITKKLINKLNDYNIYVKCSEFLFDDTVTHWNIIEKKAKELITYFEDSSLDGIFDISGGDMSNEMLPYINFDIIANSNVTFYGYSDLTTIINSIHEESNTKPILYQLRNILHDIDNEKNFMDYFINGKSKIMQFSYQFLLGDRLQGAIIGGNIRCLLKLAGTKYWPNMKGKILFLESLSGNFIGINSYFSQLSQMNVFLDVEGIVLGEFSELEKENRNMSFTILSKYLTKNIPVVKTYEIGHSCKSRALVIGKSIELSAENNIYIPN